MKTEFERISEIMYTLLEHQPVIDVPYEKINDIAVALVKEGYGKVSEYETEREMLGSQIKVLKQRLNNKYVEIEKLKAETSNIRKETAREILDMLYDMGIDKEMLECCRIFDVNGVSLAKQICENYGVEIEK